MVADQPSIYTSADLHEKEVKKQCEAENIKIYAQCYNACKLEIQIISKPGLPFTRDRIAKGLDSLEGLELIWLSYLL